MSVWSLRPQYTHAPDVKGFTCNNLINEEKEQKKLCVPQYQRLGRETSFMREIMVRQTSQIPHGTSGPTDSSKFTNMHTYIYATIQKYYVSKTLSNNRPSLLTQRLPHSAITTINNPLTRSDTRSVLFIGHNKYTSSKHILSTLRKTSTYTYDNPEN